MSQEAVVTIVDMPGARAAFSTRLGGVSPPPYESLNLGILTGDDLERVRQNRIRLLDRVDESVDAVAAGWQVHGAGLLDWDGAPAGGPFGQPGFEWPKADGHLTTTPRVPLLVLTADCLPVALAGRDRVAMLHCGWRGLAAGIVAKAVDRFDDAPEAVVGPGIGRCCYEVGDEVLEAFADVPGAADGRMLDLRAVAEAKLHATGVRGVEHVAACTSCRPERYFSHRRDGPETGRQAGMVWLAA